MSTTDVGRVRLTPTERHESVALGVKAGKSNRAIAKELGVDEGTVRRDRKFLATPENERPVKVPRLKKPKEPRKEKPARELTPEEMRRKRLKVLLEVAQRWIADQGMVLLEVEDVLSTAGQLLHHHRQAQKYIRVSAKSPAELLVAARPPHMVEDEMGIKLEFCALWLMRWLALCLPNEEQLQDEVRRQISLWARSSL